MLLIATVRHTVLALILCTLTIVLYSEKRLRKTKGEQDKSSAPSPFRQLNTMTHHTLLPKSST